MKDQLTQALDNQEKQALREFCGDTEGFEETPEDMVANPANLDLDDSESFQGLHPNHVRQVRSRLAYGSYMNHSSHSRQFAATSILE